MLKTRGGHAARRQAWALDLGLGPEAKTCGDCAYLIRRGSSSRHYFKCTAQVLTHGPGTDIGKKDPACRLFVLSIHTT
jgi:hypothetical protein